MELLGKPLLSLSLLFLFVSLNFHLDLTSTFQQGEIQLKNGDRDNRYNMEKNKQHLVIQEQ